MLLLDKSSAASFLLQDPVSPTRSPSPWSACRRGAQEWPHLTLEYLTQGLLKIVCKKNRDCHLSLYPSILAASLLQIQMRDSSLYNPIKAALLLSIERTSVFICPHARHFRNATDLWMFLPQSSFFSPFCHSEALHRSGCVCYRWLNTGTGSSLTIPWWLAHPGRITLEDKVFYPYNSEFLCYSGYQHEQPKIFMCKNSKFLEIWSVNDCRHWGPPWVLLNIQKLKEN